VFWRNPKE